MTYLNAEFEITFSGDDDEETEKEVRFKRQRNSISTLRQAGCNLITNKNLTHSKQSLLHFLSSALNCGIILE